MRAGFLCGICSRALVRRATEGREAFAKRKYCSLACNGQAKVNQRTERFWSKVAKGAADECWPWKASCNRKGYGSFSTADRTYFAHRYALLSIGVAIPDGKLVMHRCDNPPCCNPAHLSVGTPTDNMRDMYAKGRAAHLVGVDTNLAKLNDHAVREIRGSRESVKTLASRYGVSESAIFRVRSRKTWGHVQ